MEISGLGGNNPLRLNPGQVNAPDVIPSKLPPLLDDKTNQKGNILQNQTLPETPSKPVINRNTQSFQNLLTEIGVPNTPQNNQLAQTLANYGQPINRNTMNQVANSLGPLMQQGQLNIEAGVILLINNMPVTTKAIESVKQLLSGGVLTQNLLVLNKDLKKLVDNVKDKDFVQRLESKIQSKQENISNVQDNTNQSFTLKEDGIKPLKQLPLPQNFNQKVEEPTQVKKNPFQEEFEDEGDNSRNFNQNKQINQKSLIKTDDSKNNSQSLSLLNFDDNINQINQDPKSLVNNLVNKAQKLNLTLNNILSIDILKNPANFPQQVSMLKAHFAELEVDIEEIKEILESSFPELKEEIKTEDENIFTNLLKMVFDDGSKEVKKTKAKMQANLNFESELLKSLTDTSKTITGNFNARELLTNNQQCLCIPLTVPFNNKLYEAEIMINREDNSNKKAEIGDVPLKINLSIQTHNMGKVVVDMSTLKTDLQVHLNLDNINIKNFVSQKLNDLQEKLDKLTFDVKPVTCSVNPRPDESVSMLLPKKYQVMSMKRIDGIA
jgi:hypothetical protein